MIIQTTPTFTLTIAGVDLTEADAVFFSMRQGKDEIVKTGGDLTVAYANGVSTVAVTLTQADTKDFRIGSAQIQLNWTYTDLYGNTLRAATRKRDVEVGAQLLNGVI